MPRPAWTSRQTSSSLLLHRSLLLPGSSPSHSYVNHQHARSLNVFAEFVKSIRRQIDENKDFQKSVKQLSAETNKITESEMMQAAAKAAAAGAESTSKVVQQVKATAGKVAENVQHVVESESFRKTAEGATYVAGKVGEAASKISDPIMDTQVAKAVAAGAKQIQKEIAEGANPRYMEYKPKDVRERERAERLADARAANPFGAHHAIPVSANPEADGSVVEHKESKWSGAWKSFKENNPLTKSLLQAHRRIEESDSPFMDRVRGIMYTVQGAFEETEQAQVVRAIQTVEPGFSIDNFIREATRWMIPDIMETYLRSDKVGLKDWVNDVTYSILNVGIQAQETSGLKSDCKLLDLRNVELAQAKLLENGIPVLVLTYRTQEVLVFRDRLSGAIKLGSEDQIMHAAYAMVLTKDQVLDPTIPVNPRTNGWRITEMVKQDSRQGL
ncbi:hypothetical protein SmJEL517_g06117 [Synchytrium microbalum]|uniref:Tim44-like domain-containing protein n=1 Tax=Synchytrium microbalum TaxID=1806994 RepID=A0A507BX34_9FUNG|nr:uncharacterized protein SmJEL517_g06117 [Synchytrium microbalum]TPX30296.1 hypothetical protein SmJEL517_g06117 [Synchytrium microbalum]